VSIRCFVALNEVPLISGITARAWRRSALLVATVVVALLGPTVHLGEKVADAEAPTRLEMWHASQLTDDIGVPMSS
jgi:hypothetical protein